MKLKRIISIILSLMLILSAVSAIGFAEETAESSEETAETTEEEAAAGEGDSAEEENEPFVYGEASLEMLSALGIYEAEDASVLENNITRAEFLKIMGAAAGYGEVKSTTSVFADLGADDERESYVRPFYDLGIITPDDKGNIYPDANITMAEAAAVAVKITGYGVAADARGGYPTGYMTIAKSKDILKGLPASQNEILTVGMALLLTENTLKADVMVQTGFGSSSSFEEREGNNLLWTVFGVKTLEGIVTGVDISRIAGPNTVSPFFIEIDGFELEASDFTDLYDWLGLSVIAYYSDERGGIPTLVYLEKSQRNNETIINVDDIESYENGRFEIYDEEKGKSDNISISSFLPLIYNGVATKEVFSEALIEGKSGTIRLLDNTGDGSADIIFADIYETYVVSQVDSENNIVYDKYDITKKIELDTDADDPYTVIFDTEGEETQLSSVGIGDILAVFASAPDAYQGYINVYIVRNEAAGVITQIKNGGKKVIINDTEYEVKDVCRQKHTNILKAGQEVILKLDYDGKVVWAQKGTNSGYVYGFIAAAGTDGGGLASKLKFKIFSQDGTFADYEAADNLRMDGVKFTPEMSEEALKWLYNASNQMFGTKDDNGNITASVPEWATSSLVRYTLNADGEVNLIDTILFDDGIAAERESIATADNALFFVNSGNDDYCRTSNRTIGPKISYTENALVFYYPSPLTSDQSDFLSEKNYLVGRATDYMQHDTKYKAAAFYDSNQRYTTDLIGIPDINSATSSFSYSLKASVVDEVFDAYDEETGKVTKCVRFLTENGFAEVLLDRPIEITGKDGTSDPDLSATMDVTGLKKGDFVRYNTNNNGYLAKVQLYFRPQGNIVVDETGLSNQYRSGCAVRYGFIFDKFDEGMIVYYVSDPAQLEDPSILKDVKANNKNCELVMNTGVAAACYQYAPGRGGKMEVRAMNYSDLKAYKNTGEDCSRVVMHLYYGMPYAILNY